VGRVAVEVATHSSFSQQFPEAGYFPVGATPKPLASLLYAIDEIEFIGLRNPICTARVVSAFQRAKMPSTVPLDPRSDAETGFWRTASARTM
jgi:hypothetical protein